METAKSESDRQFEFIVKIKRKYMIGREHQSLTPWPRLLIIICEGFLAVGEREKIKNIKLRGFEEETNTNYDEEEFEN